MASPETKRLIDMVEECTGFRVNVGTTDDETSDAKMMTATPERPAHIINVAASRTAYADYIVAVQCAMILLMWSDERGVPMFIQNDEKFSYLVGRSAQWKGLAKLPPQKADGIARMFVQGLLHQLRSQPMELHVIAYCAKECPGLRDMQADCVERALRRATESFRPDVRELAPPDILASSAAMSATLALQWARISGSRTALIPYKSLGFLESGEQLFKLYEECPGSDAARCVSVVDTWADRMRLRTLYRWEYRPR